MAGLRPRPSTLFSLHEDWERIGQYLPVNDFQTNSSKEVLWKLSRAGPVPSKSDFRELTPVLIASIVAATGVFFLWSDLKNDSRDRGDGMITSAVVSRAGATMAPSEPPTDLAAPRTVMASEPLKAGRATR